MKFSVDKCWDCGLDLTTAKPAEVTYPGNEQVLGTCPGCGKLYFMLEATPAPEPEKKEIVLAKASVKTSKKGKSPPSEEESPPSEEAAPSSGEEPD